MKTLRRYAGLLGFSLGALWRRRGKNLAVVFALALVTSAFASVVVLTDSLRDEAHRGMAEMPDLTVSRLRGGRPALMSITDVAGIERIAGVASVRARVWGYLFVEGLGSNLVIVGIPANRVADLVTPITRGRVPSSGERRWAVLGEGVLRLLGARAGDYLGLASPDGTSTDVTIAGSFHSNAALLTADVAMMDDRDARHALGLQSEEAVDLAIGVTNPDESLVVARKISELLPGVRVVERRSLARAYDLTYGTRGGLMALALLPALIALLVLAWDRATGLSIEERREVGVLKTVGWSSQDVVATRMMEALAIAITAAAIGGITAYVYVFLFDAPGLLRALLGWSSLYPAFRLTPSADGSSLLAIAALTVVPYLAAAAVPAWRAATLDPAESMR